MYVETVLSEINRKKLPQFRLNDLDCWQEVTKEESPQKIGRHFSTLVKHGKIHGVRLATNKDIIGLSDKCKDSQNMNWYIHEENSTFVRKL